MLLTHHSDSHVFETQLHRHSISGSSACLALQSGRQLICQLEDRKSCTTTSHWDLMQRLGARTGFAILPVLTGLGLAGLAPFSLSGCGTVIDRIDSPPIQAYVLPCTAGQADFLDDCRAEPEPHCPTEPTGFKEVALGITAVSSAHSL